MGLFSKKDGGKKVFLDLEYNKNVLHQQIVSLSKGLHDYKEDSGSKIFSSYISKLLNLEILNLTTDREINGEAYAYRRGRIDSLRELVEKREVFILNEENAISKDRQTDHKAKRQMYPKRPKPSTAGLAM